MSSSSARTAKRRLLKLASLGLAGLLAGLLTGCTDSSTTNPYTSISSDSFLSLPSQKIVNRPLDHRHCTRTRRNSHPPTKAAGSIQRAGRLFSSQNPSTTR
jgi:hypothetical protein